jgi:8-oxo-dGTP pyrophosphatase MutT (NUDIX family)
VPPTVPRIPRRAGRVLVVDPAGRILLLQGFDPTFPERRFWFTIGGGVDDGESMVEAAARELREESGIAVEPAALGQPVWRRTAQFSHDGQHYQQDEEYFLLRTDVVNVTLDGLEEAERRAVTAQRWWDPAELASSGEPFYPPELPDILRELVPAPNRP